MGKGILIVMKGKRSAKNIYKLMGNAIVDGVVVVESSHDNTILWQMWLGHLGESGWLHFIKGNYCIGSIVVSWIFATFVCWVNNQK